MHASLKCEKAGHTTALFRSVLPLVAALGCSSGNPQDTAKITPIIPVDSSTPSGYLCATSEAKLSKSKGICITDCSSEGIPFNYYMNVLVADCSKKDIYHKFVFSDDGSKILWEGIGNSSQRVFLGTDEGRYKIKTVSKHGSGWMTDFVTTKDAQKIWSERVKKVFKKNED